MDRKETVLFIAHKLSDELIERYRLLKSGFGERGPVVLAIQCEDDDTASAVKSIPEDVETFLFSYESLARLRYMALEETIVPGSNHFILLDYYLHNPNYARYWNVEYDVVFGGDWSDFFSVLDSWPHDFVSTHVRRFEEDPFWYWWRAFMNNRAHTPLADRLASFNPIYRLTNRALEKLDIFLKEGNGGHHEVVIPTLMQAEGLSIADLGGSGEYVPSGYNACFYSEDTPSPRGSMRHAPVIEKADIDRISKILYHPVKIKALC